MAVFYLRKDVLRLRIQIYLNLLQLKADNWTQVLSEKSYLLEKLELCRTDFTQVLDYPPAVSNLWKATQHVLLQVTPKSNSVDNAWLVDILLSEVVTHVSVIMPLFDLLFDII